MPFIWTHNLPLLSATSAVLQTCASRRIYWLIESHIPQESNYQSIRNYVPAVSTQP